MDLADLLEAQDPAAAIFPMMPLLSAPAPEEAWPAVLRMTVAMARGDAMGVREAMKEAGRKHRAWTGAKCKAIVAWMALHPVSEYRNAGSRTPAGWPRMSMDLARMAFAAASSAPPSTAWGEPS